MAVLDLEPRKFDSIKRGNDLCEAIGLIIPDLLNVKTILSNPYAPVFATIGTPTTYDITLEVDTIPVNFTFTSSGVETGKELIDALVLEGNTTFGDYIVWSAFTNYTNEVDMYFTIATKVGYKQTAAPVLSNVIVSTEQVQAPTDIPACYLSGQKIPLGQYPLILVTPLPITTLDNRFKTGSIEAPEGSGTYLPYYDNYIKANYLITAEAGSMQDVFEGKVLSAETILRTLESRIKQDNRSKLFLEKIDATINNKWSVIPNAQVVDAEGMSIASTTVTLDIIDRWIDESGGIMTTVSITSSTLTDEDTVSIPVDQTIAREDLPPLP